MSKKRSWYDAEPGGVPALRSAPPQPASRRPPALGCGVCGNRERMVRLSLAQEGTKLLEDWLDEIRWECGHGAYSFYSGSLEDCPDDGVSVPASHTETLPINGSFKRRAFFGFSYPKKRVRARARVVVARNSRPFFSPRIMSRRCGPLYCGSGFSLLRFFLRCYAPFWPR